MTHCLNCGVEDPGIHCEKCGLGLEEAEFVFRRKLLYQTAIFLLGSLAYLAACRKFPPLDVDGILIFLGVVFFLTLGLAILLDRRAAKHRELEAGRRTFRGLVPLPWLLAILLFANGRFDARAPRSMLAAVEGKYSMHGLLPIHRIVVASWREGRRYERIAVAPEDFDSLHLGDRVEVRLGDGLIGIPWVVGISRRDFMPGGATWKANR